MKNVKLADFRMKIGRSIPYKISNWHIIVKSVKLADFSVKKVELADIRAKNNRNLQSILFKISNVHISA